MGNPGFNPGFNPLKNHQVSSVSDTDIEKITQVALRASRLTDGPEVVALECD